MGVREPPGTPKLVATAKAGGSPLGTTLELQDPSPHRQRWETKGGKKEQSSQNPLSLRQLTWGKKASKSNSSIPESPGLG